MAELSLKAFSNIFISFNLTLYVFVSAILLIIVTQVPKSEGIKCYQCTLQESRVNGNKTSKPCASFDYSKDYIIDCPYSTFCLKHTYWLLLPDNVVEGVRRLCAPQSYHQHQYENNKWEKRIKVHETAYQEECITESSDNEKPTKAEYCYCSHNLCNSGKSSHDATSAAHTDAMAVIFVFNAMKYIRSLR